MSVPEPTRHKGRLEVHVKAHELAVYTIQILRNPKQFAPDIDPDLIKDMKETATNIFVKSWQANKIRAETNKVNRKMRYTLQEEAILLCDRLHACIGIAKRIFHISSKRMKYWGGQITDVRNLLQAWKESDVSRYGQP